MQTDSPFLHATIDHLPMHVLIHPSLLGDQHADQDTIKTMELTVKLTSSCTCFFFFPKSFLPVSFILLSDLWFWPLEHQWLINQLAAGALDRSFTTNLQDSFSSERCKCRRSGQWAAGVRSAYAACVCLHWQTDKRRWELGNCRVGPDHDTKRNKQEDGQISLLCSSPCKKKVGDSNGRTGQGHHKINLTERVKRTQFGLE